jgi:hypothetical protein
LLAAADQSAAGEQHGTARSEVSIARPGGRAVPRRRGGRERAAIAQPVGVGRREVGRRAEAATDDRQPYEAVTERRMVVHVVVAGLEVDRSVGAADQATA